MHAKQMAEVAGWVATASRQLFPETSTGAAVPGIRYWSASRCRLQRWQLALRLFEQDLAEPDEAHDPWHAIEAVLQEILVSEILTRVWTAVLVERDRAAGTEDWQGVACGVYIGHVELRSRALRLLLHYRGAYQDAWERLDAIRRRVERLADLLLSRLDNLDVAAEFAFDAARVRDFAADRHLEDSDRRQQVDALLHASLAASLQRDLTPCSANPDLNREIVAGILECWPTDSFDSAGLPQGLFHLHLVQAQERAESLLKELVSGSAGI